MHNDSRIRDTAVYCTHTVVITILQGRAGRAQVQYAGKIQIKKRPALFQNLQSFDFWMINFSEVRHRVYSFT